MSSSRSDKSSAENGQQQRTRKREHRRRTNQIRPGKSPPSNQQNTEQNISDQHRRSKTGNWSIITTPKTKKDPRTSETTDIIWAQTGMASGINMSSAFNTIQRGQLIDIAKEVLNEDEIRILRILPAETTLEVKVENAQTTTFESNTGSPQGGRISGSLFTIYFNNALQQLRQEMGKEPRELET